MQARFSASVLLLAHSVRANCDRTHFLVLSPCLSRIKGDWPLLSRQKPRRRRPRFSDVESRRSGILEYKISTRLKKGTNFSLAIRDQDRRQVGNDQLTRDWMTTDLGPRRGSASCPGGGGGVEACRCAEAGAGAHACCAGKGCIVGLFLVVVSGSDPAELQSAAKSLIWAASGAPTRNEATREAGPHTPS